MDSGFLDLPSATCPVTLDVGRLREEVRQMYARVAQAPDGEFHFHRGPAYAAELLGYDAAELAQLPASATESFAGVANPLAIGEVIAGETVCDIGCGAGTDLLLAARRVGAGGKAIGVDMTEAMLAKARVGVEAAGCSGWVELRRGDAEALPLADGEADVVISNGVINLAPDKRAAFAEIARVLKPGGRLLLGDIVVEQELSEKIRSDVELWTG